SPRRRRRRRYRGRPRPATARASTSRESTPWRGSSATGANDIGRPAMLTRKRSATSTPKTGLARALAGTTGATLDRRTFLRRSGLAAGGLAAAAAAPLALVQRAESAGPATGDLKTIKNI